MKKQTLEEYIKTFQQDRDNRPNPLLDRLKKSDTNPLQIPDKDRNPLQKRRDE